MKRPLVVTALTLLGVAFLGSAPAQERAPVQVRIGAPPAAETKRADSPRRLRTPDPVLQALSEAQDLLRQNRIDDCLARLRALHEEHPDDWRVTETLGRSLEVTDRREEAIVLYRQAADAMPDPRAPLIELQRLYRVSEIWSAALQVSLEYLRRVGEQDAWVADELESLIRTDRVGKEAVRSIETALRDRPDDARLREILLLAHLYQGDPLRAMDEAAALDEERRARGALLFKYARLAQEKGRLAAAVDGYERILRGDASPALRDQAVFLRGQMLRGLGRLPEALAAFDAAGQGGSYAIAARLEKGDLLAGQMGRPDDALAVYRDALETMARKGADGASADQVRLTMADLQIRLERPGEAALIYEDLAAHAAEPEARAQALYRAGEMLFFQGKLQEAQEKWYAVTDSFPGQKWVNDALEGVLRIGENNDEGGVPLTAFAQAEYQRRLGRLDRGLALVDEALQQYPLSRVADDLLWQRTRLLVGLGRLAEARAAADTLGARYPESRFSPRALLEVAERIEADPNSEAQAQAIYLEILTRFPDSLEAPRARAALQRRKEQAQPGSEAHPEGGS